MVKKKIKLHKTYKIHIRKKLSGLALSWQKTTIEIERHLKTKYLIFS